MNFVFWFPSAIEGSKSFNEISFFDISILKKRENLAKSISKNSDVLKSSKEYCEIWRKFSKQCECNKHSIKVKRIINFEWENYHKTSMYKKTREFTVKSRVFRFETILSTMTYVQSLFNEALNSSNINGFQIALNLLLGICREEIFDWKLINEMKMPFECTTEGNNFYCLFAMYYIQKSEMIQQLQIFINLNDEEQQFAESFTEKDLNKIVEYGVESIRILMDIMFIIQSNVKTDECFGIFYACIPETLDKQIKKEYLLICSIVFYCFAKLQEDENYPIFHAYMNFIVENFIIFLEKDKEKSKLIQSVISLLNKENKKSICWNDTFNFSNEEVKYNIEKDLLLPSDFIKKTKRGVYSLKLKNLEFNYSKLN